ncbi:MAG: alkaline phosphatase family protein [Thermoanaerobaculia bacterium]
MKVLETRTRTEDQRPPSRRGALSLLGAMALAGVLLGTAACGRTVSATLGKRVIVLGFDGMDYGLVTRLMAEGRMPNFSRLAEEGFFSQLETSVPPQSPVAWSEFITGLDAGGHGIFDFVHRDPATMAPYLSTSRVVESDRALKIGKWKIPLGSGRVELLRHGKPFWEVLEEHGVETTIIRMPANFPPSGSASRELSGMGTPDLLGTPGTFSFYTSELFAFQGQDISGGKIFEVYPYDDKVEATIYGPDNPFLQERKPAEVPFTVYIDPQDDVVKLVVGDEERILQVGEWSDWVPIHFAFVPTQGVRAIVRFYLKQAHPELELYVSPLQIDPENPALPISTPESYAPELAKATGRFYTQGMPEDTKSLTGGVFTREEFLSQADLAGEEIIEQYKYVLDRFESGLLFYYFGNLDQKSHVMFRPMDPDHPAYDPEKDPPYAGVVEEVYEQFDGIVGYTLEQMPPDTRLIAMSDHGFTSWRRSFHLNTWLEENGYLTLKRGSGRKKDIYRSVDWRRTRAYGLGLNSLYINLRGRERDGSVEASQRQALMEEIAQKLLETLDPATGQPAVTKVYKREEVYRDRGHLELGPDLVVGYAKGFRGSFESALGEIGPEILTDNTEEWSGSHLMDHEVVPGILLSNRPLLREAGRLKDLAGAILAEFGVEDFPIRKG